MSWARKRSQLGQSLLAHNHFTDCWPSIVIAVVVVEVASARASRIGSAAGERTHVRLLATAFIDSATADNNATACSCSVGSSSTRSELSRVELFSKSSPATSYWLPVRRLTLRGQDVNLTKCLTFPL